MMGLPNPSACLNIDRRTSAMEEPMEGNFSVSLRLPSLASRFLALAIIIFCQSRPLRSSR